MNLTLHSAAAQNDLPALTRLLKAGHSPDTRDRRTGLAPLHIAANGGNLPAARLLLDHHADPNVEGCLPAEADSLGFERETPLLLAARAGRASMLKLLLRHGADPHAESANCETALHQAADAGSASCIKILLKCGLSPLSRDDFGHPLGQTPLDRLFRNCLPERKTLPALKLLIAAATYQLASNSAAEALASAAGEGQLRVIRFLSDRGVSPRGRSGQWRTPLHEAAYHNQAAAVRYLLRNGADVNAVGRSQCGPLHLAVTSDWPRRSMTQQLQTVRDLLDQGGNANLPDRCGRHPLHVATREAALPIIRLLLSRKVAMNAKDTSGNTPLHAATIVGRAEVVRLLLRQGADSALVNRARRTPLDEARLHHRRLIIPLLEAALSTKPAPH